MAISSVQWQCKKTLPECLLRMFEEEIACDVTFWVGKDTQEVKAHRVILMSRSPVFFSMLEGTMAEKGEITISDIDKDSFVEFLRYLYTDIFKPNSSTVMTVLYCAKKYCVDNLSKVCAEFLHENISTENVFNVLEAANRFDDDDIRNACTSILQDQTDKCLASPDFQTMPRECLDIVLNLERMNCSEVELYEGVVRWAGEECRRQDLMETTANSRVVLGDLLYKIRFPIMDLEYFTKTFADSELLTDKEKVNILKVLILKDDSSLTKFESSKRTCKLHKVQRFNDKLHNWGASSFTDKISFEVSNDALLRGIQVFGSSAMETVVKYCICIKDSGGNILYSEDESIPTERSSTTYDIFLARVINLRRKEKYTIEIEQKPIKGNRLYYGIKGKDSVTFGDNNIIHFSSATGSPHTNVEKGQIPGLILS